MAGRPGSGDSGVQLIEASSSLVCQANCSSVLAKYGVRINTVSPGPIETPILPDFEKCMGREVLDMVRSTVGRYGTVDDVVPIISFLGSSEARWINGQDIQVDAGFVSSIAVGAPIQL
jgi:NAD(P)-dependent dehydrogenase (short-subunit alcohol dehydrogenase family)